MALFGFGYKKKLENIRKKLDEGEYQAAALAADEIKVHRLKTSYDLNLIGKAYKYSGEYMQARDIFERSYEMRCSRTVLIDVLDCCLEVRDFDSLEKYFNEYQKVAPEDRVTQYMYRYQIEKKKGRDRQLLIPILEELKALQYTEEYAYELAKQYHKAGMAEECMNECNDIILWFGFGPTVERAKALLAYYKGEISLEEIRSAGAKYQEELERQWLEEKTQAAEEARRQWKAAQEEAERPKAPEVMPEAACTEEAKETKTDFEWKKDTAETGSREQEPMAAEQNPEAEEMLSKPEYWNHTAAADGQEDMDTEEDFVLPKIDLSGMGFDDLEEDDGEGTAENIKVTTPRTLGESDREELEKHHPRIPERGEYFVPDAEDTEVPNQKLAALLAERGISLPEVLHNFGRIERICKQVVDSLEPVLNDRNKAYFVITGESRTGKTTLAVAMIRLMYELDIIKYDRTATIDAVQLNQVSIEDYGNELKNCNLIIENAGGMTKESIEGLIRFSRGNKGKTSVFLEDTVRNINKFFKVRDELGSMFSNRINLGKYNAGELMGFAYDYISKEDYSMDARAAECLQNKIDEIVKEYSNDQRLDRVIREMEIIMSRAEKRTGELLLEMASEGKIQQGNYLVILPEDVMA